MENPFFRNHWNYNPQRPRYAPPSMMEVPIHHRRTESVAPKVVSIPVRFVESKKSRSDSATVIQKVFRGFLVRKIVKKVVAIEREVNEIERTLKNEETVESIRRDSKERVKFGEMLMNLLIRLDSVKGVDSGIRNFRKAVIKKAIALQEKVDSIVAADEATVDRNKNISSTVDHIPNTCDGETETADNCNELENTDVVESNLSSSFSEPNIVPQISGAGDELGELKVSEEKNVEEEEESKGRSEEEEERRDDVVERMMMEKKKMMEMMEQLFEKNEMQTQLLCSLSQRVEQLEKAFVYETLRRKKKKRSTAAIVDSLQKCPKTTKKCQCDTIL